MKLKASIILTVLFLCTCSTFSQIKIKCLESKVKNMVNGYIDTVEVKFTASNAKKIIGFYYFLNTEKNSGEHLIHKHFTLGITKVKELPNRQLSFPFPFFENKKIVCVFSILSDSCTKLLDTTIELTDNNGKYSKTYKQTAKSN